MAYPLLDCHSGSEGFESYHGVNVDDGNHPPTGIATGAGDFATYSNWGDFVVGDDAWHHVVYRYASTESGGVAPLEIYLDDQKVVTIANMDQLAFFGPGVDDVWLGLSHADQGFSPAHHVVDDVRVYDDVFPEEQQCQQILGGTWCDGSCKPQ